MSLRYHSRGSSVTPHDRAPLWRGDISYYRFLLFFLFCGVEHKGRIAIKHIAGPNDSLFAVSFDELFSCFANRLAYAFTLTEKAVKELRKLRAGFIEDFPKYADIILHAG